MQEVKENARFLQKDPVGNKRWSETGVVLGTKFSEPRITRGKRIDDGSDDFQESNSRLTNDNRLIGRG